MQANVGIASAFRPADAVCDARSAADTDAATLTTSSHLYDAHISANAQVYCGRSVGYIMCTHIRAYRLPFSRYGLFQIASTMAYNFVISAIGSPNRGQNRWDSYNVQCLHVQSETSTLVAVSVKTFQYVEKKSEIT